MLQQQPPHQSQHADSEASATAAEAGAAADSSTNAAGNDLLIKTEDAAEASAGQSTEPGASDQAPVLAQATTSDPASVPEPDMASALGSVVDNGDADMGPSDSAVNGPSKDLTCSQAFAALQYATGQLWQS